MFGWYAEENRVRPVRFGHRLPARRRTGKNFSPHAAHHRQLGTAHRQHEDERYDNERELAEKIEEIFDRQLIQTEALNFIRGRSLEKTYLIIDEAQNMTPNQVKGIITRAGKGTKIILVGDPNQIDKPFLDERTNGLTYAAGKMKGSPLCYQLTMMADECERSPLALDAIQRL